MKSLSLVFLMSLCVGCSSVSQQDVTTLILTNSKLRESFIAQNDAFAAITARGIADTQMKAYAIGQLQVARDQYLALSVAQDTSLSAIGQANWQRLYNQFTVVWPTLATNLGLAAPTGGTP